MLRVGFAGSQRLVTEARPVPSDEAARQEDQAECERVVAERERLAAALPAVLGVLAQNLTDILSAPEAAGSPQMPVASFYERRHPLLRLVTGLCERGCGCIGRARAEFHSAASWSGHSR